MDVETFLDPEVSCKNRFGLDSCRNAMEKRSIFETHILFQQKIKLKFFTNFYRSNHS